MARRFTLRGGQDNQLRHVHVRRHGDGVRDRVRDVVGGQRSDVASPVRERLADARVLHVVAELGSDEAGLDVLDSHASWAVARPPARRRRPSARPQRVRPGVQRLMDGWSHTPALVLGRCLDVLAANSLADALHGRPMRGTNVMRSIFLDPGAHDFYAD